MDGFMPHGNCYLWSPSLIGLHAGSDLIIAVSYYSIPLLLMAFVRRKTEFRFSWIFVCFATFILACGTTHLMQIWNIWHSDYFVEGYIKALTAAISAFTAVLLVRYMPRILELRSPEQLEVLNSDLEQHGRELAESAQELERFNQTMVNRELRMVELKQEVNLLLTQQGAGERYTELEREP
jgi:hypothetical protein